MKKRIISLLLVMLMVLSTAGTCVFAAGELEEPQGQPDETTTVTQENMESAEDTETTTDADVSSETEEIVVPEQSVQTEARAASSALTVDAVAKDPTSATVSWDAAPENAENYSAVITPFKDGTEEQTEKAKTVNSGNSADVSGLDAGSKYAFKVVETYEEVVTEERTTVDEEGNETTETVEISRVPVVREGTSEVIILPAPEVRGLAAYSAYNSVVVEWEPEAEATSYTVYHWSGGKYVPIKANIKKSPFNSKMYAVCSVADDYNHWYAVTYTTKNGAVSKMPYGVRDARVSRMYIKITFKQGKTLTSHDGTSTKCYFKKGQTVKAFGFGSGQYYFTHYVKGKYHTYYVNYGRVRKATALYTRSFNYSTREAEYFVLTSGKSSVNNYLIWANLYTQHMYLFRWHKATRTWRVNSGSYSHWECSSGKASTPSPTGLSFTIKNKYKRHSATRWWNTYKGSAAIHGQVNNSYGRPLSHGCIRNPNAKAQYIYNYYPKRTRVMIY